MSNSISISQRVLGWAGDADAPTDRVFLFRVLLFVHVCAQSLHFLSLKIVDGSTNEVVGLMLAVVATQFAFLAACWAGRQTAIATWVGLLSLMYEILWFFPSTTNHFYLSTWAMLLLAVFDTDDDESRGVQLQGLRWSVAIVLFYTGFQKVVYGTYFEGDFLVHKIRIAQNFADVFQYALPAAEFERIRNLDPLENGAGPFRTTAPFFLLLSNSVYLIEMALPVALIVRKTRAVAVWLAIAFVGAIQVGAREMMFGLLFSTMILLFHPSEWLQRVKWLLIILYLCLLAMSLGWLPGSELLIKSDVAGVRHL